MSVSALFNLKIYLHTFKLQLFKEMKKIEYMAPEMEEIKLMHNVSLLGGSNDPDVAPSSSDDNTDDMP